MFLKPKSTTLNPRALLYKRFTAIQKANTLNSIYKTTDNKLWLFDSEKLAFTIYYETPTATIAVGSTTILTYIKNGVTLYFGYSLSDGWEKKTNAEVGDTLLSAKFSNIGAYQTNQYYYHGSFNYVKKGAIEGSTTQYIKGNIMPISSLSIQHFDDYINIEQDDLVVINNHLYAVQNPVEDHKHQPKDFTIYSVDLIGIL